MPKDTPPTPDRIPIEATPIDGRRCAFKVARPVDPDRWAYFDGPDAAAGSPLAERLFALPGILAVLIAHDMVTLTRPAPSGPPIVGPLLRGLRVAMGDRTAIGESWQRFAPAVAAAIRAHLAAGDPAVSDAAHAAMPGAAALRERVQHVLDERVNPVVAGHGGGVSIVDVRDNVVYLQMHGGCQGCGLADLTLATAVAAAIRDDVPEVGALYDLTDHAAGRNPYTRRRPR